MNYIIPLKELIFAQVPLSLPFSEDQTQTSVVENGAKAFTVASSHSMFKPTNRFSIKKRDI